MTDVLLGSWLPHVLNLVAWRLLNSLWQGAIVAFVVTVTFGTLPRLMARVRYAIVCSGLGVIVLSCLMPWSSGDGALSVRVAEGIVACWILGVLVLSIRLVGGWCLLRRLREEPPDVTWALMARCFCERLRITRVVTVVGSPRIAMPGLIGWRRPVIVVPRSTLTTASGLDVEAILAHEVAHVCRADYVANVLQAAVDAVFFFHPAVWWIENRLTLEREMACDDVVLTQTASPKAYASSLISFAEKLHNARGLALAQALVSRMRHMSLRITQILDAKRPSGAGLWKPALWVSASLLALVFGAAPYAPQLVAFQNPPNQLQAPHSLAAQPVTNVEALAGNATGELAAPGASRAPQIRAIPAKFTMHTAGLPARLKATPRKPLVIRARAQQEELPAQETFVVVQTTQYDASGSGVWTLCIWKVRGGNLAERELESAIVVSLI
jgi:bla regulator protein BlaR1